MSTYLRICCPSCQRMLKALREHLNKRVACIHCRTPFVVRPEEPATLFSPPRLPLDPEHPDPSSATVAAACGSASEAAASGSDTSAAPRSASAGAERRKVRPPAEEDPSVEDLQEEIRKMRARIEPLQARADESERLEAALKDTSAELERARLTVKILQADLFTRAAEIERLEAGQSASGSELTRLRTAVSEMDEAMARAVARQETLDFERSRMHEEARAGWDRERLDLARRAEEAVAAHEQSEKEKADVASRLREALTRFGAAAAELEAERRRADGLEAELDASRRHEDRQQIETSRLRSEIEQQRLRRDAERQAQHEAFHNLRQTLAERLQNRTPAQTEPLDDAAAREIEAPGQAPRGSSPADFVPHAIEGASDPFPELRSHLRTLHDGQNTDAPLAAESSRTWRPEEP